MTIELGELPHTILGSTHQKATNKLLFYSLSSKLALPSRPQLLIEFVDVNR